MKKRQRFGQHFLTSKKIAQSIVLGAQLTKKDIVLEIGTGKGILLPYLCKNSKKVISIETDKELYENAKTKFPSISNLELKLGNGFKTSIPFSVFVSNIPYSQSRKAIEWLIQKKFSRAVIMVQREFAEKLVTKSKKERKAISILASHSLNITKLSDVNKNKFHPEPKVDSVVLRLNRKNTVSPNLIKAVNKLFSYRRKTIQNILKKFGKFIESEKRLDDLSETEIIKIAKQIVRK